MKKAYSNKDTSKNNTVHITGVPEEEERENEEESLF